MRALPLLLLVLGLSGSVRTQDRPALERFLGTWKGACADGQDFVVLTLARSAAGSIEGTIQLANMRGGDDGRCAAVTDPPSEQHALRVTNAQVTGDTLAFRGSGRAEFEMTVPAKDRARLRFIGTASEDNPWELRRR